MKLSSKKSMKPIKFFLTQKREKDTTNSVKLVPVEGQDIIGAILLEVVLTPVALILTLKT